MTLADWKTALRSDEMTELKRAEDMRASARAVYNATVRKLKSRAEQRIRAERLSADQGETE